MLNSSPASLVQLQVFVSIKGKLIQVFIQVRFGQAPEPHWHLLLSQMKLQVVGKKLHLVHL